MQNHGQGAARPRRNHRRQTAAVVVVAVAEHHRPHPGEVQAENGGVGGQQGGIGPGIDQHHRPADLQPDGQAMRAGATMGGAVLHHHHQAQSRDGAGAHVLSGSC